MERIDNAIVAKDRCGQILELHRTGWKNTVTNLTIMAENMLSAESRISDADIGAGNDGLCEKSDFNPVQRGLCSARPIPGRITDEFDWG